MTGSSAQPPGRGYQPGDLVEDLVSGEAWTVDGYEPGGQYHPARVVLGRDTRHGAVVTARSPEQVRVVTPAIERSIYPGDGWSDLLMLTQTGQTVAEFTGVLSRRFGDRMASQPGAAEPEAGPGGLEPGG